MFPIFSFYFNKTEFSLQILINAVNIKFHENLSFGSPEDICGQTVGMKRHVLVGAFRGCANAPKNW